MFHQDILYSRLLKLVDYVRDPQVVGAELDDKDTLNPN